MLLSGGKQKVMIQYDRVVRPGGNRIARAYMDKVFKACDAEWRGLGVIPGSGLKLKKEFTRFDAVSRFPVKIKKYREPAACICGEILKGRKVPQQCRLFGKQCTPLHPVGACMVSSEGTCAAYYKYGERK